MYKEAIRPVWAEINLSNLDYNIKNIMKKVGPQREIIGVIKADAYGHGSVQCAEVLRQNGCKIFAIATLQEAITLREAGAKEEIICLGLIAFAAGTAGGVLFGQIMRIASGNKVNPLIGSAGVSAVPMAARVSQVVGLKDNPSNYLLMQAMGPNVAGVIGTAVAAGTMLAQFGK